MSSKPLRFSALPWHIREFCGKYFIESFGEPVATCNHIEDALLIVALANEYNKKLCDDDNFQVKPEPAWRRVWIRTRELFVEFFPFFVLIVVSITLLLVLLSLGVRYAIH